MADRNFKPDSGYALVFEDAGSTDRLRITDGGSTILYEDGGAAALTINTDGNTVIADGQRIQTDQVRAYDGAGLKLYEDGGAGIVVRDGGSVVISDTLANEAMSATDDDTGKILKLHMGSTIDKAIVFGAHNGAASIQAFKNTETGLRDLILQPLSKNVGIGTTSFPTALVGGLTIANGTAPSAGLADTASFHVSGGEMYVSDASDNETLLSPHKFELFDKPDDMAWAYHSKNRTAKKKINVDMWSAFKQLEELSGKQFIFQEEWNPPQKQKTIIKEVEEEVTRTEVVLVDGKYIEKTITETITKESEELVFDEFPLYDEDGEPIMILVSEAKDGVEAVYEPKMHQIPVYG